MHPIILDIALALTVAAAGGVIARFLKQPPLLGYLAAGLVLGPLGFHALRNEDVFHLLEELGTAILLFLVGLELNWRKAREQASVTLSTGILQLLGIFSLGYLLTFWLTGAIVPSLVVGSAIALSSTVLVVKILSESHDLDSLHGRLTVGTLLLQDAAAITVVAIAAGAIELSSSAPGTWALILVRLVGVGVAVAIAARYALPVIFGKIARSTELLFTCSLAWCFVVAGFGALYGLPLAIGAFLAGISLAPLPYTLDITNRLRSIRDAFIILMFLNLGASFVIPSGTYRLLAVGLFVVVAFGKPFLALLLLSSKGYKHRTAFLTASGQGQLGEFSLLLAALAVGAGIISQDLAATLTFTAVASLLTSTVLLEHREWWYLKIRAVLHHITPPRTDKQPGRMVNDHIVIFGYHRMGYHILKKLRSDRKHHVMVVDFNPDIIKKLESQDIDAVYGDVLDEEILPYLQVERAAMVISTVPHREETLYLIGHLKAIRDDLIIIVTAHQIDDALEYYHRGATYVILPHLLGGQRVADLITTYEEGELKEKIAEQAEEVKLLKATKHALYYE